jgi:hypothetical protein
VGGVLKVGWTMRNAACQAGSDGPDTGADLAALVRELAGVGAALERNTVALERNTAALALADEQVELGRQLERGTRPSPRPRNARTLAVVRALPG